MSIKRRKSPRAQRYDYASVWSYFVTICCHEKEYYFGDIKNGEMKVTIAWDIAQSNRWNISKIFPHVTVDEYIIMPNHMHWIIHIGDIPKREGVPKCNIWNETWGCFEGTARDAVPTSGLRRDTIMACPLETTNHDILITTKTKQTTMKKMIKRPKRWSLWYIINQYKWSVTREVNCLNSERKHRNIDTNKHNIPFKRQSRYHDAIIRDEAMYDRVKRYIKNNVKKRDEDRFR